MGFWKKDKSEKPTSLNGRTEAELQLCGEWTRKFNEARDAKAPKVAIWEKCIDAYNGDLDRVGLPDYKSNHLSNFVFATIETIKPIMVDNDPKMFSLPRTPDGMEKSEKVQSAFEHEWKREKMSKKLPQALTTALQIGTIPLGLFWDAKKQDIICRLINPFNMFPDPMATGVDDAEYIIYATYKHVNQLKIMYPEKASLLDGSAINYEELAPSGTSKANVRNHVLVLECYAVDYSTEDIDYVDSEGKELKKRVRKYPTGRIITVCPELQIVLSDKKNPYKDGMPFILIKCYDVPFEFWGKGEIEQLLSPQQYINELMNQVIDNAKLTANMPWVLDKNCGIGKGQLTNRPGLIIRKNPGSQVARLQPPQMPSYVQEMIETLKRDVEIISGVHDITQGRKPGSVSAASAIIALQEAAQARIRLKVTHMECVLGELGEKWFNRMKQFWKDNRWVRITDKVTNQYSFVEILPEDLEVDVDFIVLGGSTMPENRTALLDLMIRLAQTPAEDGLPMIDREAVLYYTNIPNKYDIIQRFKQRREEVEAKSMADRQFEAEKMGIQEGHDMAEQIPDEVLQQLVILLQSQGLDAQQIESTLADPQAVQELVQAVMSEPMDEVM